MLVHQDAEIVDPDFCAKVRAALRDPDVGVVGCVGAIGVRSIAWWEGSVTWASFVHRYRELGGGELPAFAWTATRCPPTRAPARSTRVDGFVMALSPWAVRNVRFDESLGPLHGYDFDFCLQVRDAGRKVVDRRLQGHPPPLAELIGNPETWIEAHMRVAEKWDGRHAGRRRRGAATGRSAPGAPRPRRAAGARPGGLDPAAVSTRAGARAPARSLTEPMHRLAPAATARLRRRLRRCAEAPAPAGARRPSARRISSRETTDWSVRDPGALAQAREPLGQRERAATRAAAAAPPPGGRRAGRRESRELRATARCRTRLASRRSSSGLRSHGSRISASSSAQGASVSPDHAEAEEGGHDRQAQAAAARDEVLDRGQHAVARAALPGRRPAVGQPAGAHARARRGTGRRPRSIGWRCSAGISVGREVVVAAPVRPADVVEEQQRQRRARRALADQPQLLADGEVVVVAVDDHRVGQRDRRAAPRGSSRGPARGRRGSRRGPRAPSAARGRWPHTARAGAGRPVERAARSGRRRRRRPRRPTRAARRPGRRSAARRR